MISFTCFLNTSVLLPGRKSTVLAIPTVKKQRFAKKKKRVQITNRLGCKGHT